MIRTKYAPNTQAKFNGYNKYALYAHKIYSYTSRKYIRIINIRYGINSIYVCVCIDIDSDVRMVRMAI